MTMIVAWLETYWRETLFGLFWLMQAIFFITLVITAHRTAVIKKKMKQICAKVEEYVSAVLSEDEPVREEKANVQEPVIPSSYDSRSEEESRIVSAVLKEIFP